MTPTAAARAQHATANLRDRLKDPSLLKEACYIDGAWVGSPVFAVNNPATGVEIAKVPQLAPPMTPPRRSRPPSAPFRPGPSTPPSSAPIFCANGSS